MIRFVVALYPEAKPLIAHYGLSQVPGPFRVYRNEQVGLVVSGVGKAASAAATAYLHTKLGESTGGAWFNIGVAGHRDRPVGDVILADEILDQGTAKRWTTAPTSGSLPLGAVVTVDQAEDQFETDAAYEMEAAGFYSTALLFSPIEAIQCVKVISDNQASNRHRLKAKDIESLIANHLGEVLPIVEETIELVDSRDNAGTEMSFPKPPLKWAGGKRWLVPHLRELWRPHRDRRFVEPLCGGLAVPLGFMASKALLNDINAHVMNFYSWVKKGLQPRVQMENDSELFYAHRARFNELLSKGEEKSQEAAELFYYLNRTCFNGLCRFNSKGEFNVPFGRYKTINYQKDFSELKAVFSDWDFCSTDFEALPIEAEDFIYADPPYDVAFTQYAAGGFKWEDQVRLAEWLSKHRGPVALSNQATDRIVSLYEGFDFELTYLTGPRMINSTGDRTPAQEVLAIKGMS